MPDNCSQCPFSDTSIEDHAYCPSLGDISEWYEEVEEFHNKQGWTCRHPDCKLQTWEAQRVLRFVVENEHVEITPLMRKLSTPEVRESERQLLESGTHSGIVIREATQEHLDKLIAETKRFKENLPPIEAQEDDK